MTWHRVMTSRIGSLARRTSLEQRLDEELGSPGDADRAEPEPGDDARGGQTRRPAGTREPASSQRGLPGGAGIPWLEQTLQDVCYAVRLLRKRRE